VLGVLLVALVVPVALVVLVTLVVPVSHRRPKAPP
jgi:hypothetical protein